MVYIGCVKRSRARQLLYNRAMYQHWDRISVIRELLAVKHGYLELHLFSSLDLNAFIEFYVLHNFFNVCFVCVCVCVLCTIFIINKYLYGAADCVES